MRLTIFLFTFLVFCIAAFSVRQAASAQGEDAPLTPTSLQTALKGALSEEDNQLLASRIRTWIGKETLLKGTSAKVEGLTVAWAIEAPGLKRAPRIVSDDGKFTLTLMRLSGTDVYAGAATLPEGTLLRYAYEMEDKKMGAGQVEAYRLLPDSLLQENVPHGVVTQMPKWKSKIFLDTERDWWVYVPAQYKPDKPACVMVFQDGGSYLEFAPIVMDNLIAKGDMPITVGVFVNPGSFADNRKTPPAERSFEYDTLSNQYARFLLEEILPEVEKTTKLKHDPASRAIAGASSGGICAFTVAWERPDQFSKVVSWVGSFTNIAAGKTGREGGHNYEAMVRRVTPPKPIRVFLQDGDNDLDNINGNWPLANQTLAKSLEFAKYDFQFVYGHGAHNYAHGRAIFPDTLRWLWRDYKKE